MCSSDLWERVHQQVHAGDRLLIVRGDDRDLTPEQTGDDPGRGRDWLAGRVRDAGAQVDFVVAYERSLPIWSAEQQSLAQSAAMDRSVWLFSSSRALEHLRQIMPEQSWSHTRCLCTHPRIAELARRLGFSKVGVTSPDLYAVMASIKSES